ncbi:bifunctional UDP-sugar hydrolase/5'-nucleotidase [Mixta sp. Marseille-Q2057]|nr:bifunctional UDP-sugar hydrolase/5'-nucleotidase UshA [Mixta mediterraneensis]MBE5251005.1 bifunctional UDP-sugar hydrolase/5'-nucleotidase [Mixta mediterraneensis]
MLLPRWSEKGIALLLALTPMLSQAAVPDRTYRFSILHTNDEHGHFWFNDQGEYGLAAQKTLMDTLRYDIQAKGGGALILSAGDVNTGVPESDELDAEPDIRGMNLIGYDAMTLGNHEFDKPLDVLRKQEKWAKFPFLAANVYQKSSGQRMFKPWAVFKRMGLKIAVLGLITPDTPRLSNPAGLNDIEFRDPISEAQKAVAELRASEKPDVIVALTHLGYYADGKHGSNAPGDVTLARSLPKGTIDMIVGGHSHDAVCMEKENVSVKNYQPGQPCQPDKQNGVWIMQADKWGKYVGRGDFTYRNGEISLESYQLVSVNLKHKIKNMDGSETWLTWQEAIPKNTAMMKLLMPYQKRAETKLKINVGSAEGVFEGENEKVRFEQTNLGQLILRAQMAHTHADFAVMSGGGIRTSLKPGKLTWRDLLQVQPFGNQVVSVPLTGAEIKKYLAVVANLKPDSGGFAQFANVSLVADGSTVSDVQINGQPIDDKQTYRMATNSFNAAGGDGYPRLDNHAGYVNSGDVDAQVLRAWINAHSPIKASDYMPEDEIIHLTESQIKARDKAAEKSRKRSYPKMILAWIWS